MRIVKKILFIKYDIKNICFVKSIYIFNMCIIKVLKKKVNC